MAKLCLHNSSADTGQNPAAGHLRHLGELRTLRTMSSHPSPATPHRRTRADHATELAEDYVEAIAEIEAEAGSCRAVDLATRFAVSHVTVNRTVGRLQRDGYVDTEPYGPITLTDKGRDVAAASRARHEIVYRFLRSIGVSEKTAAVDAEGIEHHVSPETLERLSQLTGDYKPPENEPPSEVQ